MMIAGVVLTEDQSTSELLKLEAGTPIAIRVEGRWWAYVSAGAGEIAPVGKTSFDDQEQALQAACDDAAGRTS